ncbi:MAG: aldo/keto reductase [Alphaproteobacteria bacterium]|nr:aldo/keto reductase [Alphaproteobacteria bacterium]
MKTVQLLSGEKVPQLGLGTWKMGERGGSKREEIAAVQLAIDLGMTLIDTAEMYGEGGSEKMIAEAISGRRDKLFLVSKIYPHNASRTNTQVACERSLRRLNTDRIDLYLLHWRGRPPLSETMEAFQKLKADGKIRHYGVSNLDTSDMEELWGVDGGPLTQVNQVYYNPAARGIEFDLLPWQRKHRVPIMAYSPVDQAKLATDRTLAAIGKRHSATAAQVALAWGLRHPDSIVIPKAVKPEHLRQNAAALDIKLTPEDLAEIDKAFPPPKKKQRMEMT